MFKVNKKDSRTTPLLLSLNIFHTFIASIVEFSTDKMFARMRQNYCCIIDQY